MNSAHLLPDGKETFLTCHQRSATMQGEKSLTLEEEEDYLADMEVLAFCQLGALYSVQMVSSFCFVFQENATG